MENDIRFPLLSISRLRMETDGQGVTTLIGGAGCPLRCHWCLNKKLLAEGKVTWVTPRELYDKVKIDDLYFQATGGGVTFGGGEALLHAEFIRAFRTLCGQAWRICVETSLHVPRRLVGLAAKDADEFIVDIKDLNPEIYQRYTGGNASLVLENLRFLLETVGADRVMVRVPLIPDFNTEADCKSSLTQLSAMGATKFDCFAYIKR